MCRLCIIMIRDESGTVDELDRAMSTEEAEGLVVRYRASFPGCKIWIK